MSNDFDHSLRALENDGRTRFGRVVLGVTLVALAAWAAWMFVARVAVYVVSDSTRLEVDRAGYAMDTTTGGRVSMVADLRLGDRVEAGQVILEFDSPDTVIALDEARALRTSLERQLATTHARLDAERTALKEYQSGMSEAERESFARLVEARIASNFANEQDKMYRPLSAEGVVSSIESKRLAAEAELRKATTTTVRRTATRERSERRVELADRVAHLTELQSSEEQLNGRLNTANATIDRLELAYERRAIRAPVSGRLGELMTLHGSDHDGSVLKPGDRVGVVIPDKRLSVVAFVPSEEAVGRVRSGQHARLRLDAFPWTEYGLVEGTVARVGGESRQGTLRVEIELRDDATWAGLLQHGETGTAEIEVERLSPARLLLRKTRDAAKPTGHT
jgi:multidrug resistance efflux pump